MAIQKQAANIPFGTGIDTKTDPSQVKPGQMIELNNATFAMNGQLSKRNGFGTLSTSLPVSDSTTLATYNSGLLAAGSSLYSYTSTSNSWVNQGTISTASILTAPIPLIRTAKGQTTADAVTAPNGVVCTAYTEQDGLCYVEVNDSHTNTAIIHRYALPSPAKSPRTFLIGANFVVTFVATVAGSPHLQFISISTIKPKVFTAPTDLSVQISSINAAYDGVVGNNSLYLAFDGSDTGGSVRVMYLTVNLVPSSQRVLTTHAASQVSVAYDSLSSSGSVYVSYSEPTTNNAFVAVYDKYLVVVTAATQFLTAIPITHLTTIVIVPQVLTLVYEVSNTYPSTVASNYLATKTVTLAGVVGAQTQIIRSVGLASKIFADSNSNLYALTSYNGAYQPSNFLVNLTTGAVILRLAYSNAAGYITSQVVPSVSALGGNQFAVAYLRKSLVQSVNKSQNASAVAGIYSQTGVNLLTFSLSPKANHTAEIAGVLNIAGGVVTMFDGVAPVEQGFVVFPEDITVTTSGTGGLITAQQYFYQVCYEWTDGSGNVHRSAPSVPITITTTGATTSNTLVIPTLRLSRKAGVRIVLYRWSAAQQSYYQISSIQSPLVNDPTVDTVTYIDTLADSAIIGNNLIYTTGSVVEDVAPPASNIFTLNNSRMFLVNAEDPYSIWYSKQVIDQTPLEFSDLFTIYAPPTTGAQGSTGPVTALASLDEKLIIFKKDAVYYMTGIGPDNTGANNDLSDPVYVSGSVGCSNQSSLVLIPTGIMFQSDKGIWLLDRRLQTQYIGAPVERYNGSNVNSAIAIPGTNEVRFTLDSGVTLVYDYYNNQWGTYSNVQAVSSCLYNGLHTFIKSNGQIFQETPGVYLDGATPVLMNFKTAWLNVAGLQGYQRAFFFYLLGKYISPHTLTVSMAYDYNANPTQAVVIRPDNYNSNYGNDALYGSGNPYGGPDAGEQWRVFLNQQRCQAVQIQLQETFDSSFGIAPGAGLTLSGINLVYGIKSGYTKLSSGRSVG